ncbi:type I restriction endonuclease subunit R [Streptomyces niveus]|uniref:type I restriction endonuclease subunit R n=1 Tax=Streptomyces niveus TaxID=193462 RepID=UPI0036D1583C
MRGATRRDAERVEVELPFIQQLESMGWTHLSGKELAEREERSYTDTLLKGRLTQAIRRINRLEDSDAEWIDADDRDGYAARAIDALESLSLGAQGRGLREANFQATDMLLHGAPPVRGHAVHHKSRGVFIQYIDWEIENEEQIKERNDFLVVSQLRVRTRSGYEEVPDLVLFVNGIPVAVVECKSPDLQDPIGHAIRDLNAYTGNPVEYTADEREARELPRGIPALFKTVQLLIAAAGTTAELGTITSRTRDYAPWRSVEPDYEKPADLRDALRRVDVTPKLLEAGEDPTEQQQLIASVLKPVNLLNILRHYVFPMPVNAKAKPAGGGTARRRTAEEAEGAPKIKIVCRHQQYRAVEKIVSRLRNRRTQLDHGATEDERGGVVWHTQGSGKSLTMAFLARRLHMSRDKALNTFTLLVVTDRTQLQDQLDAAIRKGGRSIKTAARRTDIESMLQAGGRHVIFAMIQKFGVVGFTGTGGDDRSFADEYQAVRELTAQGTEPAEAADPPPDTAPPVFPLCTDSTKVLVLVDEAHRTHTSTLHACLRQAAPNAARIGFTGTPIMKGQLQDTERIFGPFIDMYKMAEAQHDKVVVPIRYEGRTGPADVREGEDLDAKFENLIAERTEEQRKLLRKKYSQPTERDVAESVTMIRAKADDMLRHYVTHVLSGGFKAQVTVVSRRATVEYRHALRDVRTQLLEEVAEFAPQGRLPERLRGVRPADFSAADQVMFWAWRYQEIIRRMEFVPVISAGADGRWREWTDETSQKRHIERFLEDLPELQRDNPWGVTHQPQSLPPRMGMIAAQPWSISEVTPANPSPLIEGAPVTFLIVKSMLLTGFDAPGEQVLYLDRPMRDAELLQAVARVNRPAPGKEGGTVVDYYGVLAPLSDALSGYGTEAPAVRASLRDVAAGVADAGEAAEKVREFLSGLRITGDDLNTRGGRARAMLALSDEDDRADFDKDLGEFLSTLERVLPHEDALGHLGDAKRWALLQQRVRHHYRDAPGGGFNLRGYGRKVRALIAEHLETPEIVQVIPPVSILSDAFHKAIEEIEDPREAAAEMEHALRYHLEERVRREDEEKYRQLSEALREVLENMDARWRTDRLRELIIQAHEEQRDDPFLAGASRMERRLHGWLRTAVEDREAIVTPQPAELRRLSAGVYEVVRKQVRSVGYRAQNKHVTQLTAHVTEKLRNEGLGAGTRDAAEVRAVARHIVNHVQEHVSAFRDER